MKDIVIVLILFATVAAIIRYFVRAKKRGETCVGCPYANQCGDKCSVAKVANNERS
ncbi:MAG: FeoB-associated Cys-rich membrane protein [Christensenellales bacterium]|jgi:radical SAM protein with 4Fe4S-binding SPASM domain